MKRYKVEVLLTKSEYQHLTVEAEDDDMLEEIVRDMYDNGNIRYQGNDDSSDEMDICNWEEVK